MKNIYSIRDLDNEEFFEPFLLWDNESAIEYTSRKVNDITSRLNQFPGEYELYHIGSFNSDTGIITGYEEPKLIINCIQLLTKTNL